MWESCRKWEKIVINFLMMAHLLLVFTALAHAAAASTQTPPDDAGAMSTFLNNMDQHRRNAATHYSSLLSTITNVTRVSILSGKKQTSVLSSTSTTSPEEWIEIGENWVSSASTTSRWGGPSQWYNPLPWIWSLTHVFHTTTVTISCKNGGVRGDPDLDEMDVADCSLEHLRIDVDREDNLVCSAWDETDISQTARLTKRWYDKTDYAYTHNRFPTTSELAAFQKAKGNKKIDKYAFTPGKSLSNLVTSATPPWVVSMTGADRTMEDLFGFCKKCTNNNQDNGKRSCGSPNPPTCTDTIDYYADWFLFTVSISNNDKNDPNGGNDNKNKPTLCPQNQNDVEPKRTELLPYVCDYENRKECTLTLSPYQNPTIRVVDVRNSEDSDKVQKYYVDVTTQVNPHGIQSLLVGVFLSVHSVALASSSLIHSFIGYVLGSTFAISLSVQRLVASTERNLLPSSIRRGGYLALYASPTLGFVALGPMYRNIVEPATSFVLGHYVCTSHECLAFDMTSTTSIISWTLKIFITTFGLLGMYLVKRWQWFKTTEVEVLDEYGRDDISYERPFSQMLLSQFIFAIGLASIYHSTSHSLLSILFCIGVMFRSTISHKCRLFYYWYYSTSIISINYQSMAEYEENGIDETAQALYELQNYVNTSEGRRQMSRVKESSYGAVSKFRDGGNHVDLEEEEEDGYGGGGWCSSCSVM